MTDPDYISPESQATQELVDYLSADLGDGVTYPASDAMLAAEEAELGPIDVYGASDHERQAEDNRDRAEEAAVAADLAAEYEAERQADDGKGWQREARTAEAERNLGYGVNYYAPDLDMEAEL
jgi:hypothetical protein